MPKTESHYEALPNWTSFIQYDGRGCPVHPENRVRIITIWDCISRKPEPFEVTASLVDWEWTSDLGDVLYYSAKVN
jgi:hypothetical protein